MIFSLIPLKILGFASTMNYMMYMVLIRMLVNILDHERGGRLLISTLNSAISTSWTVRGYPFSIG
jgi:hypothetical protein